MLCSPKNQQYQWGTVKTLDSLVVRASGILQILFYKKYNAYVFQENVTYGKATECLYVTTKLQELKDLRF